MTTRMVNIVEVKIERVNHAVKDLRSQQKHKGKLLSPPAIDQSEPMFL